MQKQAAVYHALQKQAAVYHALQKQAAVYHALRKQKISLNSKKERAAVLLKLCAPCQADTGKNKKIIE